MLNSMRTWRSLALAMAATTLVTACSSIDAGPPPDVGPKPQAPVADMDSGPVVYTGPLTLDVIADGPTGRDGMRKPMTLPVYGEHKTNELGQPQFMSLRDAVGTYGEGDVREAIGTTVHLCYKVELLKWAAAQARARAEWTKHAGELTKHEIANGKLINDGLSLGSAATGFAVSPTTPLYGVLNLFSAAQGWNSDRMWGLAMDQTERLNDLNLVLVDLFLGNEDLYLESMQTWCPVFEGWMQRHGSFGHEQSMSGNTPVAQVSDQAPATTTRRPRYSH